MNFSSEEKLINFKVQEKSKPFLNLSLFCNVLNVLVVNGYQFLLSPRFQVLLFLRYISIKKFVSKKLEKMSLMKFINAFIFKIFVSCLPKCYLSDVIICIRLHLKSITVDLFDTDSLLYSKKKFNDRVISDEDYDMIRDLDFSVGSSLPIVALWELSHNFRIKLSNLVNCYWRLQDVYIIKNKIAVDNYFPLDLNKITDVDPKFCSRKIFYDIDTKKKVLKMAQKLDRKNVQSYFGEYSVFRGALPFHTPSLFFNPISSCLEPGRTYSSGFDVRVEVIKGHSYSDVYRDLFKIDKVTILGVKDIKCWEDLGHGVAKMNVYLRKRSYADYTNKFGDIVFDDVSSMVGFGILLRFTHHWRFTNRVYNFKETVQEIRRFDDVLIAYDLCGGSNNECNPENTNNDWRIWYESIPESVSVTYSFNQYC